MVDETRERRRLLGKMRLHLLRRSSPRGILSAILALTAIAGFGISLGLLKLGMGQMWLRYPTAVFGSWLIFLLLVRAWAEREQEGIRVDEHLAGSSPKDDVYDGQPGRSVLSGGESRRSGRWWDSLDWLEGFSLFEAEGAGCLAGIAIAVFMVVLGGAIFAIGGLIVQAEVILAEVLLDVLLVSALNKRLHKFGSDGWFTGIVGHTFGPVLITMFCLLLAGTGMQLYAPEAESMGAVWRHWQEKKF